MGLDIELNLPTDANTTYYAEAILDMLAAWAASGLTTNSSSTVALLVCSLPSLDAFRASATVDVTYAVPLNTQGATVYSSQCGDAGTGSTGGTLGNSGLGCLVIEVPSVNIEQGQPAVSAAPPPPPGRGVAPGDTGEPAAAPPPGAGDNGKGKKKSNLALIAGIVAACLVLLLIMCATVAVLVIRRKRQREKWAAEHPELAEAEAAQQGREAPQPQHEPELDRDRGSDRDGERSSLAAALSGSLGGFLSSGSSSGPSGGSTGSGSLPGFTPGGGGGGEAGAAAHGHSLPATPDSYTTVSTASLTAVTLMPMTPESQAAFDADTELRAVGTRTPSLRIQVSGAALMASTAAMPVLEEVEEEGMEEDGPMATHGSVDGDDDDVHSVVSGAGDDVGDFALAPEVDGDATPAEEPPQWAHRPWSAGGGAAADGDGGTDYASAQSTIHHDIESPAGDAASTEPGGSGDGDGGAFGASSPSTAAFILLARPVVPALVGRHSSVTVGSRGSVAFAAAAAAVAADARSGRSLGGGIGGSTLGPRPRKGSMGAQAAASAWGAPSAAGGKSMRRSQTTHGGEPSGLVPLIMGRASTGHIHVSGSAAAVVAAEEGILPGSPRRPSLEKAPGLFGRGPAVAFPGGEGYGEEELSEWARARSVTSRQHGAGPQSRSHSQLHLQSHLQPQPRGEGHAAAGGREGRSSVHFKKG
ncbi:hypothetical protein GPECTOR_42g839 [Gonium pectorale]|uniref:Uncharacterized protein n=1 Tax=Gonium pectorale TaxID=33097 RepID=A0A150G9X1_GONPE|nr:hypothetical protein GPECTOR_42g839 [Gonium pectorale]|eukprot:KXZ46628.1 hypothetical protein GPECTOR_42g839 [Gonium pectorale]